jgi:hypothetical protein
MTKSCSIPNARSGSCKGRWEKIGGWAHKKTCAPQIVIKVLQMNNIYGQSILTIEVWYIYIYIENVYDYNINSSKHESLT